MDRPHGQSVHAQKKRRREYNVGVILLLVVVFLWTVASFVAQYALDNGFNKPFWVTYCNSSVFIVYLLPYIAKYALQKYVFREQHAGVVSREDYEPLPTDGRDAHGLSAASEDTRPFTPRETARLALGFASPYFALSWAMNASLKYTSVASSTILVGTMGFFTLIIGRFFRIEKLTVMKIIAVTTSFIGIALVSLSDTSPTTPSPGDTTPSDADVHRAPLWGDLLALLSALIGASYLVLFKHRVRDEARLDVRLLFGLMGLVNSVSLLPLGLLLHVVGAERFVVPAGTRAALAVLTGMGVTCLADVLFLLATLKTTPLLVSVGQSLTMPLAVLGDFLLHGSASVLAILGCLIVLASFGVLGYEDVRGQAKHDADADAGTGTPLLVGGDEGSRVGADIEMRAGVRVED